MFLVPYILQNDTNVIVLPCSYTKLWVKNMAEVYEYNSEKMPTNLKFSVVLKI